MAESKRIFNRGSVDRDIDDRLLPEGQYRDALNVNVGVSEGGDIGAVENLKGNEPVGSVAAGTTIGSVRDPNNDRVYWFNTSDTVDAIYEYDETTGAVRTIVIDDTSRPVVRPTCNPNLVSFITAPDSDPSTREDLPDFPTSPLGGCTDPGANNFNSAATFDNGSCTFDPPTPAFSVSVSGGGNQPPPSATLTAIPANGTGPFTYVWTGTGTDNGNGTFTVTGADGDTVSGSVMATDSTSATATANWSVTFVAGAISFTVSSSGDFAGATRGPASSETFNENVDFITSQVLDSDRQWMTFPTVADPNIAGLILTQSSTSDVTADLQARLMGVVAASGSANLAWSGGVTEPRPVAPMATCELLQGDGSALPASFARNTPISLILRVVTNYNSSDFDYSVSFSGLVSITGATQNGITISSGTTDFAITGTTQSPPLRTEVSGNIVVVSNLDMTGSGNCSGSFSVPIT